LLKKPENALCADCSSKSPCCKIQYLIDRGIIRFWCVCMYELFRCTSCIKSSCYKNKIDKTWYMD